MKKRKEKNIFYRFTMFVMSCLLTFLIFLILEKRDMMHLSTFKLENLTSLFFWEQLFQEESEQVSAGLDYHLLEDHTYTNGSNEVRALLDGIIIKIEEDQILVLCDNEVSIRYEKVDVINIKEQERIRKGELMGKMEESLILHFYYDNEEITLEEALQIS